MLISTFSFAKKYNCKTTEQIIYALNNVVPGDIIDIEPGTYSKKRLQNQAYFFSNISGTALKPITIKGSDVILRGDNINKGSVLRLKGDYWIIKGLSITNGLKGILLDQSSYNRIINTNVYAIGNEAIHLRDNSNDNLIMSCKIWDTGKVTPGFGEGIYIGSDIKSWNKYNFKCDNNVIENTELGPYIRAESIDIKEGTQNTKIKNNKFIGLGISGENSANSFISIKGIKNNISSNYFDATNSKNIKKGISNIKRKTELSGYDNLVYNNTFKMSNSKSYIVTANTGTSNIKVKNNNRIPSGNMYTSKVITVDEVEELKAIETEELYINNFDNSRYKFYGTATKNINQTIENGILKLEMKKGKTLPKYSPVLFRFPSALDFSRDTKIVIRVKSEKGFKIRLDIHDGEKATNGKNGRVSGYVSPDGKWQDIEFKYSDLAFSENNVNRKAIKRINFQLNPGEENFPSALYFDFIKVIREKESINTKIEKSISLEEKKSEFKKPRKYVILKLDDLRANSNKSYNKNWQRLVNTIRKKNIKASLGIVAIDLIKASQEYKDSLSYWHKSPFFEIWHHGWDHKRKNYGESKDNLGEFSGTPYKLQKEYFEKSMLLANSQLGIVMKTFGAPFNQTDSVFSKVIRENKHIKVWFYPRDRFDYDGLKLMRGKNNLLESRTGVVSYKSFLKAYKSNTTEYLVLQGHPGKWDDKSFSEFDKVIKFLKKKDVIFTLPFEYYTMLKQNNLIN